MPAISAAHCFTALPGNLANQASEQHAAHAKDAFVPAGERATGQKNRGAHGIFDG